MPAQCKEIEALSDDRVLIVGAGPVGSVLALTLSRYGIGSVLLERNASTTKSVDILAYFCGKAAYGSRFPKMDLLIARSMEIFRLLGIADDVRKQGVPAQHPFTVRFSSGLNSPKSLSSWNLPSVEKFQENIEATNDGSMPREAWQRLSGDKFESLLRNRCAKDQAIDLRIGWRVSGLTELAEGVEICAENSDSGVKQLIRGRFVVGCDGASSVVRNSLGIDLDGGQMHSPAALVHFKSRDLARIYSQGQFWHSFFVTDPEHNNISHGGGCVSQDEIETFTVHDFLKGDGNQAASPSDTIYRVLGGMGNPYPITIDEIIVHSVWRPTIAVARSYASPRLQAFLAGDSAHQTVPTGGYGMNSGIADAFDLGWKMAATIQGWGGKGLLESYQIERRPIADLMLQWSKIHAGRLMSLPREVEMKADVIDRETPEGQAMRDDVHRYVQNNDAHNQSFGVEMGYRYESSICLINERDRRHGPPVFDPRRYTPTTFPGYRAPHVYLSDRSSILDHLGLGLTLIHFENGSDLIPRFRETADEIGVPLKTVDLTAERHAREIWGANLVLVRPDGFVAWRDDVSEASGDALKILLQVTGH